jgi:serpin B
MTDWIRSTLILVALLGLVACSSGGQPTPGKDVRSDVQRVTSPEVPPSDLDQLVHGNNTFALDLYHQLGTQQEGNLFYSPYSISLALAMVYAGARGETADQMANTLYFMLPEESLHPAFNYLDLELASRGEGAEGRDDQGFRLHIANAIWGQEGYEFLDPFLDTLARNYGAGLQVMDFADAPDPSRVVINDWVSEQTEGRIEDLLPPGSVTPLTRLILTNAIYFNAAWANTFNEGATADAPFYLADGSQVNVPMMRQTDSFGYAAGEGYQIVELPYDGGQLSMVILLPDTGTLDAFTGQLDAEFMDENLRVAYRQVNLAMPRFEFESEFILADTLARMGMEEAFTEQADFSGMTGNQELYITDILHKAFVAVDEEGTEAAAATAVIVGETAMPDQPISVTVDHPFLFVIRDIETGTILFVGRVMNPAG